MKKITKSFVSVAMAKFLFVGPYANIKNESGPTIKDLVKENYNRKIKRTKSSKKRK